VWPALTKGLPTPVGG